MRFHNHFYYNYPTGWFWVNQKLTKGEDINVKWCEGCGKFLVFDKEKQLTEKKDGYYTLRKNN